MPASGSAANLTKLEHGALLIAAAFCAEPGLDIERLEYDNIARFAVVAAKAVLAWCEAEESVPQETLDKTNACIG